MNKRRDHLALERRRKRSAVMFEKGYGPSAVGRKLGVTRQVASRWKQAWERGGRGALSSKGQAGPKSKLNPEQIAQVTQALLEGPRSQGYKTD